jgi:Aspartyl protease
MAFAARAALLCVVALTTLGANRSEGRLTRLLESMRNTAGPVWTAHIVSVSRLSFNGAPSVVSTESSGLRVTLRRCNGELCDGTYFDGQRVYSVNMNGTAVPQSTDPQPYLRGLRLISSLDFFAPSFFSRGGRMGDSGNATINGKSYRTFIVGDASAYAFRVYVDPASNLVRFARELDGSHSFEYRNYRRVGAFMIPFEVRHDGQLYEHYDDRAVVSSAFTPPHGLPPTFTGNPQPIGTDPDSVTPIVDCSVGGVAVRCLIDTGNSGLSMSSELASRLGAPVVGTYRVRGLGGYQTQVVRAGRLRLGNAAFPEAYYIVLDDLRRYGYDVVLGADLFGSTGVAIDGSAHLVRLGVTLGRAPIALTLSFENFVPVVNVGIGSLDTRLAVDTGDESNVNLAYDFYSKHSGLFAITARRPVSGIGGGSVELIGEIPQVRVGDYRTGPQRIGTTQTLQGTASGHLGAAFLQQFVAQFDYATAQLHLIPRRT